MISHFLFLNELCVSDADKGIDLEMVLQSMELSIDESVKQMTHNL